MTMGRLSTRRTKRPRWHAGQLRRSGDPYVTHPVEVAAIVANLGLSPVAVCAAILHDTVDDTPYTFAQMRAEFGNDVTAMVEALPTSTQLLAAALAVDAGHASHAARRNAGDQAGRPAAQHAHASARDHRQAGPGSPRHPGDHRHRLRSASG